MVNRTLILALASMFVFGLVSTGVRATTDTAGGSGDYFGWASIYLRATPINATENGTLQTIAVNMNAAAGNLVMGVYSDNGGVPDALLAVADVAATQTGWNTFNVSNSSVSIVQNNTYWIAGSVSDDSNVVYGTDGNGLSQTPTVQYSYTGTMPVSFGSSSLWAVTMNMRMTYEVPTPYLSATFNYDGVDFSTLPSGAIDQMALAPEYNVSVDTNTPYKVSAYGTNFTSTNNIGDRANPMEAAGYVGTLSNAAMFNNNHYAAMNITTQVSGYLSSLKLFVWCFITDAPTSLLVWNDSGGAPSNEIARSAISYCPQDGNATAYFNSTAWLPAGNYWIGMTSAQAMWQLDYDTSGHGNIYYGFTSPPTSIYAFGTGTPTAYEINVTAPHAFGIGNLKMDTNTNYAALSVEEAVALTEDSQDIDTAQTGTDSFHGWWLSIPEEQYGGHYTSTVTITYSNIS